MNLPDLAKLGQFAVGVLDLTILSTSSYGGVVRDSAGSDDGRPTALDLLAGPADLSRFRASTS
jgi:hypothetical protein